MCSSPGATGEFTMQWQVPGEHRPRGAAGDIRGGHVHGDVGAQDTDDRGVL